MEIYRAIYTHAQEILIREGRMGEIMAMEILAEIMVKRVVEIVAEIVAGIVEEIVEEREIH